MPKGQYLTEICLFLLLFTAVLIAMGIYKLKLGNQSSLGFDGSENEQYVEIFVNHKVEWWNWDLYPFSSKDVFKIINLILNHQTV